MKTRSLANALARLLDTSAVSLLVSLVALLLTAHLGIWSVMQSFRYSSDSEESIDLVGRVALGKELPSHPNDIVFTEDDSILLRGMLAAESLHLEGRHIDAVPAFLAAESLATKSKHVFLRLRLGLRLAEMGYATEDTSFQRRALAQYDYVLGHKNELGIDHTLWAKSLRWWARSKLNDLGKLPPSMKRELDALRLFVGVVVVVGLLVLISGIWRRCGRRPRSRAPTPEPPPTPASDDPPADSTERKPDDDPARLWNEGRGQAAGMSSDPRTTGTDRNS
jgi:hypothetical protein